MKNAGRHVYLFFVMIDLNFYYVHLWLGQEGVHVWVRGEEGGGQWGAWGGGGVYSSYNLKQFFSPSYTSIACGSGPRPGDMTFTRVTPLRLSGGAISRQSPSFSSPSLFSFYIGNKNKHEILSVFSRTFWVLSIT